MGIRFDTKSKSYLVRIRRRGVALARTFERKADAEAFYNAKIREILDQSDLGKKRRYTLAEGIERYLDDEVSHQRSKDRTESNVRAILPMIAGLYLDQIDDAAKRIRSAVRQSRSPSGFKEGQKVKALKPATINRRLAILRRIAKLAHDEWHWIDRPIAVRLLPEHNKRHEYLSTEEIAQLSAACREPVNHWVMVAAYTGIRRGEMFRLTADSIRGDNIYLGITKNGKPILLPVAPPVKESLLKWLKAERPDPRTLHKYFKAGAKAIGRPDLRPHDLRHTTASLLLNAGYDLSTAAEVLNCTIANAQRYAHLSLDNKRGALTHIAGGIGLKLEVKEKAGSDD